MTRILAFFSQPLQKPALTCAGHAGFLKCCLACLALIWFALAPLASASAPVLPDQDTDADLIPDVWEIRWGLNINDPSDAELDPDGDRLTNRDEFYADTDPHTYNDALSISDWALLSLFQGKAFVYFWEQSRPPYYFTPDKANYNDRSDFTDNFNSIATTGFAIMSYAVADERGWISHQAAYERIRTLLARAVQLQSTAYDLMGVPPSQQGNRHGLLYHFVENQGTRHPGSEISTIDHALFVAGALFASEYYRGTELEQLARQLYENTDWNWLYNGSFLYQGWIEDTNGTFEGGRTLDQWNRYSELLVLLVLSMGQQDASKGLSSSAWDNLTYGTSRMFPYEYAHLFPGDAPQNFAFVPNMPNTINEAGYTNSGTEFHYLHAGSLHNHQYSHMFLDFRSRRDRYQTDFFTNSIAATMANRQYCINLNTHAFGGDPSSPDPYLREPYETYGPESWGIMAGIPSFTGYSVMQPIVMYWDNFSADNIAVNNDSGTVVLSAALGSAAFTPRVSIDFTRNMLSRFQASQSGYDALIGRYGFRNSFNLGRTYSGQLGHFPPQVIGLDLGPIIGSIEDIRSGLVWKMLLRNTYVQRGMELAGFPTGVVEPFILNFDDNPPSPHEDPNGGGQDPNSFGGSSYAWGNASVAYEWIGDPFPNLPFGPQQWVERISVSDSSGSGAFALLNNHSVSNWDRLSFWIKGQTGGEAFEVGLKDRVIDRLGSGLQATEVKLPIASYHPSGIITNQWTEIRIPLRDFASRGVRLTELDNISFTNSGGGGTIYVDDIAFLGDEFVPQPPQGLSATTDGHSVSLTWQPSSDADVVGYRVFRSNDGGANYEALNSLLLVDTAFTDTAVSHRSYLYGVSAVDNAQPENASSPSANAVQVAVNQAPVIDPIPAINSSEGQQVQFIVIASDPDNDPQTLSASQLPSGAAFTLLGDLNSDGQFTQSDLDILTAGIFNPGSLSPTQRDLADLNGDGALSAADLTALSLAISNAKRYGRFRWTPLFDQAGAYSPSFTTTDGQLTDTKTVLISVTDVPVTITTISDSPDPFSPNSDSFQDTTSVGGIFSHAITSGKLFVNRSGGQLVRVLPATLLTSSKLLVSWDGKDSLGQRVADGTYTYTLIGWDAGGSLASGGGSITVDTIAPVVSALNDSPDPFSPNAGASTMISFTISEPSYASLKIYNSAGALVRTLLSSSYRTTLSNAIVWNGKNGSGIIVSPGLYTYRLYIWDKAGNRCSPYPASSTVTVR